jgi:hypothetical protein
LNGSSHDGNGHTNGGGANGNLAEEVVNNALRYRAQAPILDSLLAEIGLTGGDIHALTQGLTGPKNSDGNAPKTKN